MRQHEEQATEPYVIRDRDRYAVVQPATGIGDEAVDCVIASGIETLRLPKKSPPRAHRDFEMCSIVPLRCCGNMKKLQDDRGNNWLACLATEVERARDFKLDPPTDDALLALL